VDRDRVAEAAARFLDAHDPTPETWFGKNTITHGALAGYRALRLVTEQGLDVGPDSWRRWAPAVLAWPLFEDAEHGPKKELVRRCFAEAPQVAAAFFLKGLDAAARRNGVWHLSLIADARLDLVEDDLTRRMLDPAWPVELRADVLRVLLERGSNTVQPAIAPLLTVSALADDRRDFVLAAARQLMNLAPDAGWPTVWPLVLADEAFGTALFRGLADFRRPKLGDRLGEDELGELFAWLEERFPHADDPDDPDGSVSTRTQMAWWRDALASELATVGTSEAVAQLDRLVARFPQVPWLAALRANAQEAVRRSRWRPPSPSAIVRMGADAARRWVRSDAELREVLLESLGRAQDELQAVTPAAIDLWDTVAERPKSENEISDWLQRWLRQDLRGRGVLVDREVQITPGPRGKMGQSGDLVVSALAGQRTPGADVVTVTVEVKGCWNRDLDTAMQTQLVERYLATVGRREGIYLVAWFGDGTGWTTDHRARSRGIRRDLSDARAFFADQARRLSAAGPVTVDSVVLDCSQGSAVRAA
jgi:hypothetical protein